MVIVVAVVIVSFCIGIIVVVVVVEAVVIAVIAFEVVSVLCHPRHCRRRCCLLCILCVNVFSIGLIESFYSATQVARPNIFCFKKFSSNCSKIHLSFFLKILQKILIQVKPIQRETRDNYLHSLCYGNRVLPDE